MSEGSTEDRGQPIDDRVDPRLDDMTELWIASGNQKKRRELERLLEPVGFRVRGLDEAPVPVEVVEDRDTFAGNAELKATSLARAVSALAIGDDSGLCVDALGGQPGVHSARWAGEGRSDAERVAKLLAELDGVPEKQRRARFVCHVCLAGPGGEVLATFEASCPGFILGAPRGSGGFGYDPVFVAEEQPGQPAARSFAELTAEEKDRQSHRGRALRKLREFLAHYRTEQAEQPERADRP